MWSHGAAATREMVLVCRCAVGCLEWHGVLFLLGCPCGVAGGCGVLLFLCAVIAAGCRPRVSGWWLVVVVGVV